MSTDAMQALAKLVAQLGRDVADLRSQMIVMSEQNRELREALGNLNVAGRSHLAGTVDDGLSPEERKRRYKRDWVRMKRAKLKDGDFNVLR